MTPTRKPSSAKIPRNSGPSGPSYPAPIQDTTFNVARRGRALGEMSSAEGLDVLVVSRGVTGAGIVLDAATHSLRTDIVEMGDWAPGTSSWFSKLAHGGLRYLYQFNFALMHEALTECSRPLSTTALHLIRAQSFLQPLRHHYERSYSTVSVGMYDALALAGSRGRKTVSIQRHLGRKSTSVLAPSLDTSGLVGFIRFFSARVDDAHLVIDLVRTAADLGALAANHTEVTGFLIDERGYVHGTRVTDLAIGTDREVRAEHAIDIASMWTEDVQDLATDAGGLKAPAPEGIHVMAPKEAIDAEIGVFLRTKGSVLFITPWPEYWVIDTTDTPQDLDVSKPVATVADAGYIPEHANSVLSRPITRADIIGVYVGLRLLLQPKLKPGAKAAFMKVSREHTVTRIAPGLTVIVGGKLTTHRVMVSDAVGCALGEASSHAHPCTTQELSLMGAVDYRALAKRVGQIAGERGWALEWVTHLLDRYGGETPALLEAIGTAGPEECLGEPLGEAPTYLRAEVAWAVAHEGAESFDDTLLRRVRLDLSCRDRGLAAADEAPTIMAPLLNWSEKDVAAQKEVYVQCVTQITATEAKLIDTIAVTHITEST